MKMRHIAFDEMNTIILVLKHRAEMRKGNNLQFIKKMAKVHFKIADKEFNNWYLHFLKLYWKEVDNVERT